MDTIYKVTTNYKGEPELHRGSVRKETEKFLMLEEYDYRLGGSRILKELCPARSAYDAWVRYKEDCDQTLLYLKDHASVVSKNLKDHASVVSKNRQTALEQLDLLADAEVKIGGTV